MVQFIQEHCCASLIQCTFVAQIRCQSHIVLKLYEGVYWISEILPRNMTAIISCVTVNEEREPTTLQMLAGKEIFCSHPWTGIVSSSDVEGDRTIGTASRSGHAIFVVNDHAWPWFSCIFLITNQPVCLHHPFTLYNEDTVDYNDCIPRGS